MQHVDFLPLEAGASGKTIEEESQKPRPKLKCICFKFLRYTLPAIQLK